jgi:hypothetical protein
VRLEEHVHESIDGIEKRMVEIQVNLDLPDCIQPFPHFLADYLGYALIIPSSGTAQVPFGVVPEKVLHITLHACGFFRLLPRSDERGLR